ncbi:MAG: HYR domain-containing protein, partial [Bacteroidales bacterium]|nr:HYR domain-containing protein [Bacteroidales bacterium]
MNKIYFLTFFLLSCMLFSEFTFANKYYVNDSSLANDIYTTAQGNDANSGTTPGAPKRTLGAAITTASAGDTIYIDAGTYTGTGNISLNITKSVTIIGAGTGNTIFTSHTNNRFMSIKANNVSIYNLQIYDFFYEGTGQAIMVDPNITGFTLTNIVMKRNLGSGNSGGASIFLSSGSSTIINSILFSCSGFNGSYGGAIKVEDATLIMNKSVFFQARDNDGFGGAVGISGSSSFVSITNSVFQECNSKAGGAIGQLGGTLTVKSSCFTNNFIQGYSGTNTYGGGHYFSTGTIVSATFSNCSFSGAFFCSTTNPPAGSICQFDSNPSNDGKSISIRGSSGTFNFDTCFFNNNNISTSFDDGLDFYIRGGVTCFVNINECKFANDQFPSNSDKVNIFNYDVPSANFVVKNSGLAELTANQDGTDGNNFSYKGSAPGGTSNNSVANTTPITSCANINIAGCDDISINCATEINSPVIITCATDKVISDCSALGDYRTEVAAFDDCSFTVSQNPAPGTVMADGIHNVVFTVTDEAGNIATCTITVTVSGCGCLPPPPPTGSSTQSFCSIDNPTVADLIAIGTAIQWYDVPTGGSVLSTALALTNNSTYYASQTIGGCESDTRLAVTVTVADPASPTGTSAQSFC